MQTTSNEPKLDRFLTPLDAAFLDFESPSQPLHLGSCMVYDGLLSKRDVLRVLEGRLAELPRYRQRVVETPFRVSHPMWVDDPNFDPADHVFEIELTHGLDRRAIGREVGRCFEGQLDRDKPLWKIVLMTGLECGRTLLITIVHHAMIDGVSGVDLMMVLNDLSPEERPASPVAPKPGHCPELPTASQRLAEGLEHQLSEVATRWVDSMYEMMAPSALSSRMKRFRELLSSALASLSKPAPRTPFNAPIGEQRDYAAVELSTPDFRCIRSQIGGTVNDVVLAILSGGLGRYLRNKGAETDGLELKCLCPVSMRRKKQRGDLGNLVSSLVVPLHVGIEDPERRLKLGRETMYALKRSGQARALHELVEMGRQLPPSWQWFAGRLPMQSQMINTVSSHISGPRAPLYLAGHELLSWYPMGPISADVGLFAAILSYNQKITIGLTVDPELVPDVWDLAECIEQAYRELYAVAEASRVETEGSRTPEEATDWQVSEPSTFDVFPFQADAIHSELPN